MLKSFKDVIEIAKGKGTKRLAVGAPHALPMIQGLELAMKEGLIRPILIGDTKKIRELIEQTNFSEKDFDILEAKDEYEATFKAVELVREGKADLILKGKIGTPDFLRIILHKEKGLRTGRILSHIALHEVPGKYHKLIFLTDAGMNIRPDLEMKIKILENCLEVTRKLGYDRPRVAILASIETIHPDMPETLDAAAISKLADRGYFGNVAVDGPLGFDLAVSKESGEIKGVTGEVIGDADIMLVPDVATGNIMSKTMIYFADALVGGVVVGAKVPVVLLSRSDTPQMKLASISFAIAMS